MQFMEHHAIGRWLPAAAFCLVLTAGCGSGDAGSDPAKPASGGAAGDAAASGQQTPLADDSTKASYSLGYRFAENVQRQFAEGIDTDAFVRGVDDRLSGRDAAVDAQESERVLTAMMEARQAKAANEALHNLESGLAFLEKNGKRDGVTTTTSGLQYEVLKQGEGDKPVATDTVTTHYEGRLVDGTVFDSSYERGEPATFPLNGVIAGWTEGLQLMSPGAKYRFFVPADLAYGDRRVGPVPPNSALIFDVELLAVNAEDAATGAKPAAHGGGQP